VSHRPCGRLYCRRLWGRSSWAIKFICAGALPTSSARSWALPFSSASLRTQYRNLETELREERKIQQSRGKRLYISVDHSYRVRSPSTLNEGLATRPIPHRDHAVNTKTVSYTPETLPPLTKADRARLKALAARPDSEIDTSDIPEMTDEQWKNAKRGYFHRPRNG